MDINFGDLLSDDEDIVENPREIFLTLDKDEKFSFLRDVQADVLDGWFEQKDKKDSVIKLNTGSGKTLAGLLILKSCLNSKNGPAIFIASDNFLVDQVYQEAEALGIEVTKNEKDASFSNGSKILIANIDKLFNGRSVFGVGREGQKIPIGSIVIDDVHACLNRVVEKFSVKVPSSHPLYQWILKKFQIPLERQSFATYLSIVSGDPQYALEIPFWAIQENAEELLTQMHGLRETEELLFNYPLISDVIKYCRIVVSGSYLEIRPNFPPTDLIPSFSRAQRRIFMTATLADDSVLATHFGAKINELGNAITSTTSQAMGERMILMPQELNPDLSLEQLKKLCQKVAEKDNVVVIVPSAFAAASWSDVANQSLVGQAVTAGIAKLRNGLQGITVLVGRYDGIDLPKQACRLLVIYNLPEVSSLVDSIDIPVLGNTRTGLQRQIQRIEQGMGRGVRSSDDYCVVLLYGSRLVSRLLSAEGEKMLSPATRMQLELSKNLAKQMSGASVEELLEVMQFCLARDKGWTSASKKALLKAEKNDQFNFDDIQLGMSEAFELVRNSDPKEAANVVQKLLNSDLDDDLKAWLKVRLAEIVNRYDKSEAQHILQSGYRLNRSILKPIDGVSYEKLKPFDGKQPIAVQKFFKSRFLDQTQRLIFVDSVMDSLVYEKDCAEPFEKAILDLGNIIGINSQRPELQTGKGPDNLWVFKGQKFFIIECKNGAGSQGEISKADLGQLEQATTWFEKQYGEETDFNPVMWHPFRKLGQGGTTVSNMRVVTAEKLDKLKKALYDFSREITDDSSIEDIEKIKQSLVSHGFTDALFLDRFTVSPK